MCTCMDVHAQFNVVSGPYEWLALISSSGKTAKWLVSNDGDKGNGRYFIISPVEIYFL